jgi:hypothetical protein
MVDDVDRAHLAEPAVRPIATRARELVREGG